MAILSSRIFLAWHGNLDWGPERFVFTLGCAVSEIVAFGHTGWIALSSLSRCAPLQHYQLLPALIILSGVCVSVHLEGKTRKWG